MGKKTKIRRGKRVKLGGFVLIKANGNPIMWAQESTRLIGHYAWINKRLILDDNDYGIEMERMKRDGWRIAAAEVTVEYA